MTLELSESEVDDVTEALRTEERQLLDELAHADSRAFRAMLRAKASRVERLLGSLERSRQNARPEPRADV